MSEVSQTAPGSLAEVAGVFLRLGFTAFGGPAAHIAMMRAEIVQRRGWLSDKHFADLLSVVNLIPGPNSTELGLYLGYLRAGWPGLIVAGACFIGPAMLIVMAFAWAYVTFGSLPDVGGFLYGVKPVVLAIIAQALWGLGQTVLRRRHLIVVAAGILALYLLGVTVIALLLGAGMLLALGQWLRQSRQKVNASPLLVVVAFLRGSPLTGVLASGLAFSQMTLFLTFLKTGAVLYGSGYVLLAFLHGDFVTHLHWLTDRQLLDAVSVGQFTPGPVFTTATFIGYLVGGVPGALVATLGIFLPAFIFVPLIHPLATRLRTSPITAAALDGVNAAALALMAGVLIQLGQAALRDLLTWLLALAALAILLRFRLNSAWLILGGGAIGLLIHR